MSTPHNKIVELQESHHRVETYLLRPQMFIVFNFFMLTLTIYFIKVN
jgi:hypothetical protein